MMGKGYTILETMIVLAISASLFVTAVVVLGGRQQEIQFSQAVRDFDSRLQDLKNDVSTGFFNNAGNTSCELDGSVANPNSEPLINASGADAQGSSNECVFIGKAIQFHPQNESASTVNIYNIVGRRVTSTGSSVNSLEEARPVAVGPTSLGDTELSNEVEGQLLGWGLRVTAVKTSPTDEYGAIGFFTSFSNTLSQSVGSATISNNQSVRYGAIPGSTLGIEGDSMAGDTKIDVIALIKSITDLNPPNSGPRSRPIDISGNNSITICLQNAEQTRRAAIVIGEEGSTTTTVQFDDYDTELCGV